MADSTKIKGITIEIGGDTQPLSKALKNAGTDVKELQSEIKIVNKLLKLDPSNNILLTQKKNILAEEIEKTTKKLELLTKTQEQAKQQLDNGEISAEQYRALERQIIETKQALDKLNEQAAEVEASMSGVDLQGEDTAKSLDDVAEGAKNAEKNEGKLSAKSVALGTVIGNLATKLFDFARNAVTFLTDSVGATQEFRSDLSKLEMNAKSAGTSIDDVSGDLEYLIAVTNESDSSVEALSNLLKAGFTEETLTQAVNNLSGAVIQFPDTLKIESLADSLQETLATGAATGQYGELLERLGVNLDDFNAGLQKCTTSAEKQKYAIDILAKNGLANINEQYKAANADLIAYSTAQTKYTETLSKVGEAMQPIMTVFANIKTTLLEAMIPALQKTADTLTKKLASSTVQNSIKKLGKALGDLVSGFADFVSFVIENSDVIISVITDIGLAFAWLNISKIIATITGIFKQFVESVVTGAKTVITAIKNIDKASMTTIIGAIVMVITVVAQLANAFLGASEETQNLKDDMIALGDEAAAMQGDWTATEETIALNADTMRSLAGEIQSLDEKIRSGKLSSTELAQAQAELQVKTTQYNAAAGEEVLKIDSVTGAIVGGTSALDDNTEALIKNAEKQAQVNALEEAYKGQTEVKAKEAQVIEELYKYYDKLNPKAQEAIDNMKEEGITWDNVAQLKNNSLNIFSKDNNEVRTLAEGLEELIPAEEDCANVIEYLTGIIGGNTEAQAENTNATGEAETAIKSLTEQEALQLLRRQENGETLTQIQQEQLESYKANNEAQYTSLEELVQKEQELQQKRVEILTDTNNKIDYADKTSLEQRVANMENNAQKVEEYESGLAAIKEKVISEGNTAMLQYLETLGGYDEESMAIISQIVQDYLNGGGEMANALADGYVAALGGRKSDMEGASYQVGSDTQTAVGEGVASNSAATTEAENQLDQSVQGMRSIILDDGNFYYLGIGIINKLAAGMSDMAWKLYDTTDRIVNNIKSKFSFDISVSGNSKGGQIRGFATGGIVSRDQIIRVAERGPEAIIPLDRLGGIIQNALGGNGGSVKGNNTYVMNVYPQDMTAAQQQALFNKFDRFIGQANVRSTV